MVQYEIGQVYSMLSETHWMLYNLSQTEEAKLNKTYRQFLETASHNAWEALVEFDHIVSPVEED